MDSESCLRQKLSQIWPHLNERSRRLVAAAEAVQLGRGGVSLVSRASGLSRVTVTKGIRELGDETVPTTRPVGIRNRRYAGPVKAPVPSPGNWLFKTTRLAMKRLLNYFGP